MCCNEFVCINIEQDETKWISNPDEWKQIMHIGNQLYSSLSQLSRQSVLLLTDLPSMLKVLEEDYQLEYSESDTSNVYGGATGKARKALESLLYLVSL